VRSTPGAARFFAQAVSPVGTPEAPAALLGEGSSFHHFRLSSASYVVQWGTAIPPSNWAQVVDASGALVGGPREIWRRGDGGLYLDSVVLDGAFRAFDLGTAPTSNWTTEEPYSQLTLERISEDLTTVWSAPRTFDGCGDDVPQTWHGTFGDPAGGVWLVLRERQLDRNGYPVWLTRVHRIDETGASRW
jgi:hypothetical protein